MSQGREHTQTAWRFGTDSIPEKESHPHLGIHRSSSRISSRCNNIMQSGSKTLFSLTGSGAKRRGLSPPILTTLWETYCIPRMLYGTEIINLHEGEKTTLDKYQNQVFKTRFAQNNELSSCSQPSYRTYTSIHIHRPPSSQTTGKDYNATSHKTRVQTLLSCSLSSPSIEYSPEIQRYPTKI